MSKELNSARRPSPEAYGLPATAASQSASGDRAVLFFRLLPGVQPAVSQVTSNIGVLTHYVELPSAMSGRWLCKILPAIAPTSLVARLTQTDGVDEMGAGARPPNVLSGDTDGAIEFLQSRAATHPLWHPQLSFKRTDPITGEEGGFETASFPRSTSGSPDWNKVRRWIGDRQGRGNIYWTVNAARPTNKKPSKEDITAVVSLHVDLDPRDGEDQDAAEKRLIGVLESHHHPASVVLRSGGGAWGIYDLAEPLLIGGDPDKIKAAEAYNIALERELGGDNCHNIDRVARLPGTINLPNAKKLAKGRRPKLAVLHDLSPNNRYSLEQLKKLAPPISAPESSSSKEPLPPVDMDVVRSADCYEDLPEELRRRFQVACQRDARFADLWKNGASAQYFDNKDDNSRSVQVYALIGKLKRKAFTPTECGRFVWVWEHGYWDEPDKIDERLIGRAWNNNDAQPITSSGLEPASAAWEKPTDFWAQQSEPSDLPGGVVPEIVERFARDRGRRLGVEAGAPAACFITTMASAISASNTLQMRQKDTGWTVKPILWTAIIADSGSNKSATLDSAMAPLAGC